MAADDKTQELSWLLGDDSALSDKQSGCVIFRLWAGTSSGETQPCDRPCERRWFTTVFNILWDLMIQRSSSLVSSQRAKRPMFLHIRSIMSFFIVKTSEFFKHLPSLHFRNICLSSPITKTKTCLQHEQVKYFCPQEVSYVANGYHKLEQNNQRRIQVSSKHEP